MRLYVVLRRSREEERPMAAFSSRERALLFVDERALDARVVEVKVRGDYSFPSRVHAVSTLGPGRRRRPGSTSSPMRRRPGTRPAPRAPYTS